MPGGYVRVRVTGWVGRDYSTAGRDVNEGEQFWAENGALATHGRVPVFTQPGGEEEFRLPAAALAYDP